MRCEKCKFENPENIQVCINCGYKLYNVKHRIEAWHSLHNLLWDNKINQDIVETINELKNHTSPQVRVSRKYKKSPSPHK